MKKTKMADSLAGTRKILHWFGKYFVVECKVVFRNAGNMTQCLGTCGKTY